MHVVIYCSEFHEVISEEKRDKEKDCTCLLRSGPSFAIYSKALRMRAMQCQGISEGDDLGFDERCRAGSESLLVSSSPLMCSCKLREVSPKEMGDCFCLWLCSHLNARVIPSTVFRSVYFRRASVTERATLTNDELSSECLMLKIDSIRPWSHLAKRKYTFITAIAVVCVTSNFRQSSSIRRMFKTSNGPTSASGKADTTLGACYANKP